LYAIFGVAEISGAAVSAFDRGSLGLGVRLVSSANNRGLKVALLQNHICVGMTKMRKAGLFLTSR